MSGTKISPQIINQINYEYKVCYKKARKNLLEKWSKITGYSPSQLYRLVNQNNSERKKIRGVNREYREWAKIVHAIKKKPPEEAGEISTEMAIKIAVMNGLLPEEALNIPASTYNRIGREEKFDQSKKPVSRFMASRPNMVHHFDGSHSAYFYVKKQVGDEYILKMHRPAKHYKNKPVKEKMRVLIYGLTDDHSGKWIGRYTVAAGESIADSLLFLQYAWSKMGLPEKLFADQGVLKKGLASAEFISRLGVELPQMMPYAKEGHGKIERPWRTVWQGFEKVFFACNNYKKFEISLTELNQALDRYIKDYNSKPHRLYKDISREAAWRKVEEQGGIVKIPENALATVAKRLKRKVGQDHIFTVDNVMYYVKEIFDTYIYVYLGVFDNKVVVQDINTGKKYEARKFEYRNIDEFKGEYKTPHQELKELGETLDIQQLPYTTQESKKVTALNIPISEKEERKIANPLNIENYENIQEAMQEFFEIVSTRLTPEETEEIRELILSNNLNRQFVRELALEIRAELEQIAEGGA
jgi:ADP-ribose pyrophosphatase YjhB (NUDIX family)